MPQKTVDIAEVQGAPVGRKRIMRPCRFCGVPLSGREVLVHNCPQRKAAMRKSWLEALKRRRKKAA